MASKVCRWGILGAANIARKNWKAIRNAENATLTAVASREPSRAKEWIAGCQSECPFPTVPEACDYDALLKHPNVDAVYIPLPTGIRPEWVLKAANAGKHILCEKPCAPDAGQLRTMIDACKAKNVQFMDGVMFMHGKRLPLLRSVLDDGETVGTLRRVATQFSFAAGDDFLTGNIRVNPALEPLGALGDLGWYNIRFTLWVMKYLLPTKVCGRLLTEHSGVPLEFSAELFFPGGVSASFYCSFNTELQQWAHVSGTKGSVAVRDFVLPFYGCESEFVADRPVFNVKGTSYHWESHPKRFAVTEYSDGTPDAQETNMICTFSGLALSGKLDPTWPEIALKTQLVMDACLASARKGAVLVDL
ncbi:Gfo/Idh/MocA family protein [Frigoriglobus tundricola]|uniref:1,5-anhydro-D-fructose reductase n=1 Tax=Frigoriglobus tundricola TaxID=2774151 RepID=A0A6M5Z3G5_9BACT|nr:Gfo/Idh/MocA family oxidoreductase [Frigoriglobus tundricola]QJX00646.1 1,5-anhydro-D-fructose reductase [Frigoriglobus tundricola]